MKILSRPKKNAEEYGKWAVNPYVGCSNQCEYCYLRKGPSGKYLGQDHPVLKKGVVSNDHAYHLAMTEIIEHKDEIIRDGGLFFTFTSDPLLYNTRNVCLTIASWAVYHDIPVVMLTKCASFYGYEDDRKPASYYLPYRDRLLQREQRIFSPLVDPCSQRLALGWTLTGHDEEELRADKNAHRIAAMKELSAAGFKTWASIEPVIDFDSSLRMVQQALDAGCRHFKIGLMTRGTKVCRHGFTLGDPSVERCQTFEPYDPAACLAFVQDVMRLTADRDMALRGGVGVQEITLNAEPYAPPALSGLLSSYLGGGSSSGEVVITARTTASSGKSGSTRTTAATGTQQQAATTALPVTTVPALPENPTPQELLDSMTLRQKVYQMFICDLETLACTGTVTSLNSTVRNAVESYPVGGVILFAKNLQSRDQTTQLLSGLQDCSDVGLFTAVDEEGGDLWLRNGIFFKAHMTKLVVLKARRLKT